MHSRRRSTAWAVVGAIGLMATGVGTDVANATSSDTCESAPPVIDSTSVTKNVQITNNRAKTVDVVVTAHDQAGSDPCANDFNGGYDASGMNEVTVYLNGESEPDSVSVTMTQQSGDSAGTGETRWTGTGQVSHQNAYGLWSVDVSADDNDFNSTENSHARYFHVRGASRFAKVTVRGTRSATKVSGHVDGLGYSGYKYNGIRKIVRYSFKRRGSHHFKREGTSRSHAGGFPGGAFHKRFKRHGRGIWKVWAPKTTQYLATPSVRIKVS